jgi:coenzyme F420-0:L-glutamate ligase/coenzyme F420-1:gamma-L-glutamate ligase
MTARTSPGAPPGTLPVTVTPLLGLPEVKDGDNVADMMLKALQHNGISLIDGDILVVSSKIVSKAMGLSAPSARQADVVL